MTAVTNLTALPSDPNPASPIVPKAADSETVADNSIKVGDSIAVDSSVAAQDGIAADNSIVAEEITAADSIAEKSNITEASNGTGASNGNGIEASSDNVAEVSNGAEVSNSTEASNGITTEKVIEDDKSKAVNGNQTMPVNGIKSVVTNGHAPTIDSTRKPLLVLTAPPVMGHTTPLLRLSGDMTKKGFEVIFMSTQLFKGAIEKTGAEFYESTTPFAAPGYLESRGQYPPGLPTLMADMENMFIKQMAPRSVELRKLLELVRERDPARNVVVITETMSLAPLPFMYGAPLPKGYTKFPKTINVNTVPIMILSEDTGITGPCLPPDASESGRARNKLLNEMLVRGPFGGTDRVFHESLKDLGCTTLPKNFFQNAWLDSYDTTFQLCVPSLEYPRSDLHLSIRFSGSLPKRPYDPNFQYPTWWPEIKSNAELPIAERKKIVAVAQGTVALDYNDLIVPTIKGLAKRPDVILVVILGVKGASLKNSDGFEIPSNARVIDHLPYDAILEYADIFITNGGYGGMSHGVLNGVPMILSGTSEDKAEVCARGAYAGFAINLRAQNPTSEQIHQACETIFTNPIYKQRALRLMQENEDLDCVSIFEREITKYAKANVI